MMRPGKILRGIVLERQGDRAVILTPEGEFRSVHLRGADPAIGEEISLRQPSVWGAVALVAAAVALIVMLVSVPAPGTGDGIAWAYLGVDINPSWELALDRDGTVVGAVGFDPLSGEILQKVDLDSGGGAADVVRTLMRVAGERMDYWPGGEGVLLTLVPAVVEADMRDEQPAVMEELGRRLEAFQVAEGMQLLEIGDPEFRARAREQHLSPGRYALHLLGAELAAQSPGMDAEAMGQRAREALDEAGAAETVVAAMNRQIEAGETPGPPIVPPGRDSEADKPGPPIEIPGEGEGPPTGVPAGDDGEAGPGEEEDEDSPRSGPEFAPPGWERRPDGTFAPPGLGKGR